ncbi:MAG: hypothetical protein PHR68_01660 [Candidatus Gracilibacteria bacterium]|nr:hypothetical protein [Candidatus Gracilibacteria bacterium]
MKIKQAFLSGIVFLGTVILGFYGFAAYSGLSTQPNGATITQTIWNDVIDRINLLGTDVSSLSGTLNTLSQGSGLGVGQTRQDLTSSRAAGTTYTNNTGKAILVSIYANNTNTVENNYGFIINGLNMAYNYENNTFDQKHEILVPSGFTYKYVMPTGIIAKWFELR